MWKRYILVDTHSDMIQFAYVPDECVIATTESLDSISYTPPCPIEEEEDNAS